MENKDALLYHYRRRCIELEEELTLFKWYTQIQTHKLEEASEINEHLRKSNEKLAEVCLKCRLLAKTPLKYKAKAHTYKVEMRRCQRKLQRIYDYCYHIEGDLKASAFFKLAEEIRKLRDV